MAEWQQHSASENQCVCVRVCALQGRTQLACQYTETYAAINRHYNSQQ